MQNHKYDIFISYRREGGAQYARILQLMLAQRGYKVFLDYDELTDGKFSEKIKNAIKDAPVFMPVLSQNSMNRCINEDDWVRQEILLAANEGKHFIPINPDNSFNGVPENVPQKIRDVIENNQHTDISFGQMLGVNIDWLVKNRLETHLGKRNAMKHVDNDFDTAKASLDKIDAHNRFMKRLGIAGVVTVILIIALAVFWFWKHTKEKEEYEGLRIEVEKIHKQFGLQISANATIKQIKTIDDILNHMTPVNPDSSLWFSQFEFTRGQWNGILENDSLEKSQTDLPMTDISYAEINMHLLDTLRNLTQIEFDLPSSEEWMYAACGGDNNESNQFSGSDNPDDVAWYKDNSGGYVHPSNGQQAKDCNSLDLFDMSGNVGEICNSPFITPNQEVLMTVCGGNYLSQASEVAVDAKSGIDPNEKSETVGFRLIIRK